MDFTIKGLKSWTGTDGLGYQATLYYRGSRIAQFTDDGNGGTMRWTEFPGSEAGLAAFRALACARYPVARVTDAVDLLAASLSDAESLRKKLATWTRAATLFYRPDTPVGDYLTIKRPLDDKVRAYILNKYPDAVIINGNLDAEVERSIRAFRLEGESLNG